MTGINWNTKIIASALVFGLMLLFKPQPSSALELKINLTIFDKKTNKTQKTTGYISVDDGSDVTSRVKLLTRGRKPICNGIRKILVARENFLSGSFNGTCFGFKARGKWSQNGARVKFRWGYKGSWIETR